MPAKVFTVEAVVVVRIIYRYGLAGLDGKKPVPFLLVGLPCSDTIFGIPPAWGTVPSRPYKTVERNRLIMVDSNSLYVYLNNANITYILGKGNIEYQLQLSHIPFPDRAFGYF